MEFEVTCSGLARGKRPDPCIMVIFGATGDLARHTLVPAVFALGCKDLLPERFAVIGFARKDWSDSTYRAEMRAYAEKEASFSRETWEEFSANLFYVRGDFTAPASEGYQALANRIHQLQAEHDLPPNVLFHLSTPPHYYADIAKRCAAVSLLHSAHGWRRVIIEKPFGHDEASARQLDREILSVIREDQLFRIDHYLGKETVQNMLVFRFTNAGFEPIWNRNYIDNVQITVAEDEGIGTRAGYYDSSGAVRDMIQNHLLQLLCMTAMESPVFYDGTSLRNETFKVLQAVRPINVQTDVVLGQYMAGTVTGEKVVGYREEANVPPHSTTPTYAAIRLMLDNWRWAGVPFYLRTGKRLPRKLTEIMIYFKPTPHLIFPIDDPQRLQPNVLAFRLQPDEGIMHTFLAKQPGPDICLQPVTMHFRYARAFGIDRLPSAYEWLILDAMQGEQILFPRSDWIYRAWAIVDPINMYWESNPAPDWPNYAAGTWGPAAADRLLKRDGRKWQVV